MIDTEFEQHGEAFRAFAKVPLNVLLSPTHTIKTMEQKTILEWFQYAKAQGYEWADAAIANCDKDSALLNEVLLSEAITVAFHWKDTEQGLLYWSNICDQLRKNNQ